MPKTSERLSSLAGRYIKYTLRDLSADADMKPAELVRDIRSLAASALRQDETPKRGFLAKVLRRG